MALYHAGDRVIVRPDIKRGERYWMSSGDASDVATSEMEAMANRTVTIKALTRYSGKYKVVEDENGLSWTDDMFIPFECTDDFGMSDEKDFSDFLLLGEEVRL